MSYNIILDAHYDTDIAAENALTALSKNIDCTKIIRTNGCVHGHTTGEKRNYQNDLAEVKKALNPECTEGYIDAYFFHETTHVGKVFADDDKE